MTKIAENILSLNSHEAMDFFMKSEQYHGFKLPEFIMSFFLYIHSVQNERTIRYNDEFSKS